MLHTDLFEMLEAVKAHVKTTGPVEAADDPKSRILGFKSTVTSESWTISLTDVKRAFIASKGDPEKEAFVRNFQTLEDRLKTVSV